MNDHFFSRFDAGGKRDSPPSRESVAQAEFEQLARVHLTRDGKHVLERDDETVAAGLERMRALGDCLQVAQVLADAPVKTDFDPLPEDWED